MKTSKQLFFILFLLAFSINAIGASSAFNPQETSVSSLNYPTFPTNSVLTKKEQKFAKKYEKLIQKIEKAKAGNKSWIATLLLCFFLGGLGIHRFYLGYTWQGIVQLLTLGGLGIWVLIDFIRIIIKDLKPKDGEYDQ